MKIVVPPPLYHDTLPPGGFGGRGSVLSFPGAAAFAIAGIVIGARTFTPPAELAPRHDLAFVWMMIVLLGTVAIALSSRFFSKSLTPSKP